MSFLTQEVLRGKRWLSSGQVRFPEISGGRERKTEAGGGAGLELMSYVLFCPYNPRHLRQQPIYLRCGIICHGVAKRARWDEEGWAGQGQTEQGSSRPFQKSSQGKHAPRSGAKG